MSKRSLAIGLLASVMITLSGCDSKPDKTFGAGTIIHLDGNLAYRQDNDWVYASNQVWVHSKELEGQHCDKLEITESASQYVTEVVGTNCHTPKPEGNCMAYDGIKHTFETAPCPPWFDNQDYHQSHPAEPGSWSSNIGHIGTGSNKP